MKKIAIIGAGIAGLTLAHRLKDKAKILIFDKSRGVSGRTSTRRRDGFYFNHGAQFLTARTETFRSFIYPYIEKGILEEWKPQIVTLEKEADPYTRIWFEPHYVGKPNMNSFAKELASDFEIELNHEIQSVTADSNQFFLNFKEKESKGPFDWVISTAPPEQSGRILPESFSHYSTLKEVKMQGCFALMLGFEENLSITWDAAEVKESLLSWIQISKRENQTTLLAHTDNEWAEKNLEEPIEQIEKQMLSELTSLLKQSLPEAAVQMIHRWRYAKTAVAAEKNFLIDYDSQLAACGDWCLGAKIEDAFTSAYHLGEELKHLL